MHLLEAIACLRKERFQVLAVPIAHAVSLWLGVGRLVEVNFLALLLARGRFGLAFRALLCRRSAHRFGGRSVLLELFGASAADDAFRHPPFDVPAVVPYLFILTVPRHESFELAVQLSAAARDLGQRRAQFGPESLDLPPSCDKPWLRLVAVARPFVGALELLEFVLELESALVQVQFLELDVEDLQDPDGQVFRATRLDEPESPLAYLSTSS